MVVGCIVVLTFNCCLGGWCFGSLTSCLLVSLFCFACCLLVAGLFCFIDVLVVSLGLCVAVYLWCLLLLLVVCLVGFVVVVLLLFVWFCDLRCCVACVV